MQKKVVEVVFIHETPFAAFLNDLFMYAVAIGVFGTLHFWGASYYLQGICVVLIVLSILGWRVSKKFTRTFSTFTEARAYIDSRMKATEKAEVQ
jgi:hypothetical protein